MKSKYIPIVKRQQGWWHAGVRFGTIDTIDEHRFERRGYAWNEAVRQADARNQESKTNKE